MSKSLRFSFYRGKLKKSFKNILARLFNIMKTNKDWGFQALKRMQNTIKVGLTAKKTMFQIF